MSLLLGWGKQRGNKGSTTNNRKRIIAGLGPKIKKKKWKYKTINKASLHKYANSRPLKPAGPLLRGRRTKMPHFHLRLVSIYVFMCILNEFNVLLMRARRYCCCRLTPVRVVIAVAACVGAVKWQIINSTCVEGSARRRHPEKASR